MIYSTCTIDRTENEENAAWIEREFPELSLVAMKQMLPGEAGNDGCYISKFVTRKHE